MGSSLKKIDELWQLVRKIKYLSMYSYFQAILQANSVWQNWGSWPI